MCNSYGVHNHFEMSLCLSEITLLFAVVKYCFRKYVSVYVSVLFRVWHLQMSNKVIIPIRILKLKKRFLNKIDILLCILVLVV